VAESDSTSRHPTPCTSEKLRFAALCAFDFPVIKN